MTVEKDMLEHVRTKWLGHNNPVGVKWTMILSQSSVEIRRALAVVLIVMEVSQL